MIALPPRDEARNQLPSGGKEDTPSVLSCGKPDNSTKGEPPVFGWLGRAVVRHPWWTIVAWLIAAAVLVVFAPKLTTESDQQAFLPS